MSPDRLEEWGFCEGKELVVLTRLCCGSLVRKCRWTCDTKRQWKLSEFGAQSPACELQQALLPCLLKPQGSRACQRRALPGTHPRLLWLRQERCPCKSRALQSIPTALPALTSPFLFPSPCPTVARARWRFLSGCFPSWAFPICLLNMYLSSLLPGGALLSCTLV